ncbi:MULTISPECIES: hypothetical protein [Tepidimonas]|jgi:hypothetical protein|uniref:Uncharacterized protein n=2 Tax=Tepidimonas TaxID=114248 RepID=A0A554XB73_9BURK|nr:MULTISPECIES: hypothetical protein [Tepidimonas]MCX8016449.1 hypothetical protein [Rhodocyclaceae bacterium]TCS98760.1 hypothetical protein EDC36_104184 [Tepidimonas ignava]TSE20314.1 hypothetical protein Tigna_01945 [Tepidimonas ignava]TSE33036.1 hypothetical protein Tchar_01917 [Tepidimonas charontis]
MHPRQQIRAAVRDVIAAALPELANRIHVHRAVPLARGRLPAILIYAREERLDDAYQADPGARRRILTLAIEIVAAGEAAHEEADALCAQIEAALEADETLSHRAEGLRILRAEIEQDGEGETPLLACRIVVEVAYWTLWQPPSPGSRPSLVLYSIAPEIGRAFEDRYQPIDA